ncbi:DUF6712 family protein [Algibacter miyuki]|uniref:DUF6712 family protein n=1 Tax=Algibacter miyuki TaxID=1306933 RepID=A0ABV5H463_9FLAO|nr:DUF6712 family protein [Algibacter miyuki]MDN3665630.1 hypothetical protein [Algibacter miyuki]
MELLFTDSIANQELKGLLGFLDMDIPFANMKGKIKTATNDVINLIGKDTYDLAVVEYKKLDTDTEKNHDLIFAVRNPIAIQGYRKYAPHNDLSHTSQGRLNRLETNQKSPFQWMIDKDDAALERSYYEALDDLIKYLDENIAAWKETDQYKITHNLFISTANDFDEIFPIGNSRLLLMKLAPGQRRCENKDIKAIIGKELFAELKADPTSNEELVDKIKEATAYYALAWAMRRFSVQLFPEGALQAYKSDRLTTNASKPAENNEAYSVAAYFEIDAKETFAEIEQIITDMNTADVEPVAPMMFQSNKNDKFLNT